MSKSFVIQKILVYILFLCFGTSLHAQKADSTWKFEPAVGIGVRSTPMYFFNFNFIERYSIVIQDYNWEKNLQGLSFQPSLKVSPPNSLWFVQVITSFRYDYLYDEFVRWDTLKNQSSPNPQIRGIDKEVKEFIFEPQVALFRKVNSKTNMGLGLGLVNTGKSYTTIEGWKNYLEFYTIDFLYQRERPRMLWEIRAHYIKKGQFPRDPFEDLIMYSARIAYRFNKKES
jgi:hypothetical protein